MSLLHETHTTICILDLVTNGERENVKGRWITEENVLGVIMTTVVAATLTLTGYYCFRTIP